MGLFTVVKAGKNAFKAKKVGGGKKPSKKDLTDFLDRRITLSGAKESKDKIGKNVEQTMKEVAFVGAPAVAITQTIREKNKKARNTKSKKPKNPRSPKNTKRARDLRVGVDL
jgi:hypothetical protein